MPADFPFQNYNLRATGVPQEEYVQAQLVPVVHYFVPRTVVVLYALTVLRGYSSTTTERAKAGAQQEKTNRRASPSFLFFSVTMNREINHIVQILD